MKFLVIDTETGGLDPEVHSILSVAGVLWEPGKEPSPLFDYLVREDDIKTTPEAMQVNSIGLDEVARAGLAPEVCVHRIEGRLDGAFGAGHGVCLAGHNVNFDRGFLRWLYREAKRGTLFDRRYSHRMLDSMSVLLFLQAAGAIPERGKTDLDRLLDEACIPVEPGQRHTAAGDALLTARALESFVAAQRLAVLRAVSVGV